MACNQDLQRANQPYPRTCADCGLGPCKKYPRTTGLTFHIEQIALCPKDPKRAIELLSAMGLNEWARDHVVASGDVYPEDVKKLGITEGPHRSEADLAFNYQGLNAARELEVLHYTEGFNWMRFNDHRVSHLGSHVTEEELVRWRAFFAERGISIAQEVLTESHSNPVIAGKRWYQYVIFDTFDILSVDLKFIVRRAEPPHGQ